MAERQRVALQLLSKRTRNPPAPAAAAGPRRALHPPPKELHTSQKCSSAASDGDYFRMHAAPTVSPLCVVCVRDGLVVGTGDKEQRGSRRGHLERSAAQLAMENYESLGAIGEGTYGAVLKCRHKVTGQIVAIKKFKESDDDEQVKKTALRKINVLKQPRHENVVSLLEVFRVKGKLYLVFEYVEKTILEEIEKNPEGLDPTSIKRLMWQLVRAIGFCHQHNIIHRDIKPENLLVSRNGVLKLCDFGFARPLAGPGAKYTKYVSMRWYRAPELLVGDVSYGRAVDAWPVGCVFAETTTGLPLFPGDSDIDQLYYIIKCLGHVTARQQELFRKNSLYVGVKLSQATELEPLLTRFPQLDKHSIDFLRQTIQDEPLDRWTCAKLLKHPLFGNAGEQFEVELQEAIARDLNDSAAIRKKRARKSSRGGGGHGGGNLPSSTFSIKSTASYDDPIACDQQSKSALKPTFKPMLATPSSIQSYQQQPQPMSKGKGMSYAISNSNSPSTSSHSQNSSKAKGILGTGIALIGSSGTGGAGGGYHLLTLYGAMFNSSSTSSTLSGVNASGGTGDTSPYGGAYTKKHGGSVPPIAENQPSYSIGAEHMEFVNHHANVRQSMTSHGGRVNPPMAAHGALSHPFSFGGTPSMANGTPPKPPTTSSYMRNPYLAAQTPTTKHRVAPHGGPATVAKHGHAARLSGYANSNSLQTSSDIYSPKKVNTGQVAAPTTHSGAKKARGEILTPQGIYVPPRTSHSTIRDTLNQNGDKAAKARRENDVRSF